MAPISPDNTQRYYLDYETCSTNHTLLCRAGSTVVDSDASATIAAFLAALGSEINLLTVTGFRRSAPGSSVTNPVTWGGAATYGAGVGPLYKGAYYIDFVGRGATGHRVRVSVFGAVTVASTDNYRTLPGEASYVAACIAELTSDADIFLDVDYEIPTWHNYANIGINAYWRNKLR